MKSLFGNCLLALIVFAACFWFAWQKDQKQIEGLAAANGAPAAPVAAAPATAGTVSIQPPQAAQ